MTSLHTKLKELRELRERATPERWTNDYGGDGCMIDHNGEEIAITNDREFFSAFFPLDVCKSNAEFIVQAANNWLTLIESLEKATDELSLKCMCYGENEPQAVRNPCGVCRILAEIAAMLEGK